MTCSYMNPLHLGDQIAFHGHVGVLDLYSIHHYPSVKLAHLHHIDCIINSKLINHLQQHSHNILPLVEIVIMEQHSIDWRPFPRHISLVPKKKTNTNSKKICTPVQLPQPSVLITKQTLSLPLSCFDFYST